jgi:FkbM family methyltransferase
MHQVKLALLGAATYIPGQFGENAAQRYYRRRRAAAAPVALAEFEACVAGLPTDSVVLDLGANVGEFTARLARHAGMVHAFEPDPWTFEKLRERVGHLPNVQLYQKCIGLGACTVTLRRPPGFEVNPDTISVGCSTIAGDPSWTGVDVEQIDFATFVNGLGRQIDLIKMDIEGAEVALLEALLEQPELQKINSMFVETHEVNIRDLRPRISRLRARISGLSRPRINLDWP